MWDIGEWIRESGRSVSEVARRAGVSRSTINRIIRGEVSPTLQTVLEIAFACDVAITVERSPASDPYAAHAARLLLEEGFSTDSPERTQLWLSRIERLRLTDPVEIITSAGQWASPTTMPGARFYAGDRATARAASAGDSSGEKWAVSGVRVLGAEGVDVVHAAAPEYVNAFLSSELKEVQSPAVADVIVAPAAPATFFGSWVQDSIQYVAPIQVLIDAIGIGGKDAQIAVDEARGW